VQKEEVYYPAPDPGEIDDELPERKTDKKSTSALSDYQQTEKYKEKEQELRREVALALEAKFNAWEFKDGAQKNIRTLFNTLDTLLWEGSRWKKPSFTDLADIEGIRKVMKTARLVIHPDKLPKAATIEQRVIAEHVYDTLNKAFQLEIANAHNNKR